MNRKNMIILICLIVILGVLVWTRLTSLHLIGAESENHLRRQTSARASQIASSYFNPSVNQSKLAGMIGSENVINLRSADVLILPTRVVVSARAFAHLSKGASMVAVAANESGAVDFVLIGYDRVNGTGRWIETCWLVPRVGHVELMRLEQPLSMPKTSSDPENGIKPSSDSGGEAHLPSVR
jgi:hypothetical protein